MAAAVSSQGETTSRVEIVSPKDTSAMATTNEALEAVSISFEPPNDPDAQNTVTDFIDFTEYLPADMIRSLTLIGSLDERYSEASIKVNDLTTIWSTLPSMPAKNRPAPVRLRADISEQLKLAVNSRVFAHAEAVRMSDNVNHHYHKAKILLEKLQKMMETYPTEEQRPRADSKSPQMARAKLTAKPAVDGGAPKTRHRRIPPITVPGEVLAPFDIEYDTGSDESDVSSDDSDIRRTPAPKIKLVTNRAPKSANRSSRVMSYPSAELTAAQAASAAALMNPPPEDAVIGSVHAPWLRLTDYELAKLRKRMKKNAAWTPSETMVVRELEKLGRGPEQYKAAKKKAEAEGQAFEAAVPSTTVDNDSGMQQLPAGAVSADRLATDDMPTSNRGMKLNAAKKLKKEIMAKQAAEELAKEQGLPLNTSLDADDSPKATSQQKRKRDSDVGASYEATEITPPRPQIKRPKVETPVPPPQPPSFNRRNSSISSSLASNAPQTETPVPIPVPMSKGAMSPTPSSGKAVTTLVPVKPPAETPVPLPNLEKRKITPVYPPVRETRSREAKREVKEETVKPNELSASAPQGAAEGRPRRSVSRGLTPAPDSARRPGSRGKAASQEPPSLASDRPRRASTARNTPAPEARPPAKRPKRPAPGVVSRTSSGGNSAVGKRKAAPKKKTRTTKKDKGQSTEMEVDEIEVDDEGNPIDPEEPRYCICNGVSFGTMIECERGEVSLPCLPRTMGY